MKAVIYVNILIADPDRDFLMSFKALLEIAKHTVTTVFDGTQVIAKLASEQFDTVILNENIPRVPCRDIVKVLNEDNIPVLVISEKGVDAAMLSDTILANSYIRLPFLPSELSDKLEDMYNKKSSGEKQSYSNIEIDEKHFILGNTFRVTSEEINVLKALSSNSELDNKRAGPYINALNHKLEKLNTNLKIKYMMNEGYRLVTDHE